MDETSASNEPKPIDYEPKGKIDMVGVLYVAGGIPCMILFFLILFGLVGACDTANTYIPA
ncbi:MAG: hypothetical protein GY944_08195 [bacterium]|nr:hypothetical protein [bacterium]